MKNISSTNFFNIWYDVVSKRKTELLNIWRNNKEFTYKIKGSNGSILSEIAKELDLSCYEQDYYFIDAIFFRKEDLTPKISPNSFWFRNIRIAFEHENNFRGGLYQEVSHLLLTACELRVLVTYPTDEDINIELDYLHDIISGSSLSNKISEEESFLLIFGYENGFEWEGYIYKLHEWQKTTSNSTKQELS